MTTRLAALGVASVVTRAKGWIHVRAHVPRPLSPEQWQELLAALAMADAFGLIDSSEDGRSIWAGVHYKTPATVDAARGHGHQP
ncbi:hypothetical protein [Streptomyces litmocidini]|uniref:hypothetical protein n=1 Tax=Streptomyces litmocidini TaxID=67318 RepID=UPI00167D2EC7|nr:hypothetical protein [Streptomyces litmocidini]